MLSIAVLDGNIKACEDYEQLIDITSKSIVLTIGSTCKLGSRFYSGFGEKRGESYAI